MKNRCLPAVESRFSVALKKYTDLCSSTQLKASEITRIRGTKDEKSRMDMTWVTGRIAVGGGIWSADNMADVVRAGVTHIIDMQIEFDDTALAEPHGIEVLWNATDDDFQPKSPELLQRGVDFAFRALDQEGTKLFIHCAAGVHRAPMMTLAVLASLGWKIEQAMQLIEARRPVVDFAEVYVESVQRFVEQQKVRL